MAIVFMQPSLRKHIGGHTTVEVEGRTLRQVIVNLDSKYPGIQERLIHPDNPTQLARGLAAVVDGEPTNMGMLTPLEQNSEVHFLPAISGG
ncbi:MAG: molybdopterin synthase sulfur carrier subunit [Chloroflexi bacterium]|nr:molybdopterin synthase sulfur carrier subunit [Chloroflexota bacterium]